MPDSYDEVNSRPPLRFPYSRLGTRFGSHFRPVSATGISHTPAMSRTTMPGTCIESDIITSEASANDRETPGPFKLTNRLYATTIGLSINMLAALENTIVAVAALVLLTELQLGDNFIWITNALFVPVYGGTCTFLGRLLSLNHRYLTRHQPVRRFSPY
ncbi:hypothetical protein F4779DRAFT_597117 [Xylariaceae sp. FL0662B]|nr:hypothetical protein F4779DRAFT_597117 [Xylariaceae sp. FL0662B]